MYPASGRPAMLKLVRASITLAMVIGSWVGQIQDNEVWGNVCEGFWEKAPSVLCRVSRGDNALFLEGVSENTKSSIPSAFVLPRIVQPEEEASPQKRQCYEQNGHEAGILRRICILDWALEFSRYEPMHSLYSFKPDCVCYPVTWEFLANANTTSIAAPSNIWLLLWLLSQ